MPAPSKASQLAQALADGFRHVGEITIQTNDSFDRFHLSHQSDASLVSSSNFDGLEIHEGADAARGLSLYADDGSYRFAKAEVSLRRGWVLRIEGISELLRALDGFYPASVGVWLASRDGSLEVENLRDKLNRQTGMYRYARTISDAGAQRLVRDVCGPAHQCARRILWQLDERTPLEDSEASRFTGILPELPPQQTIPLLCREACNHFVAECRAAAKAESAAAPSA